MLEQGYPSLEIFVIDGGSTDQTISILKSYEEQLTHWVSEKDDGQANAINKGMRLAKGEILAWLNSDDILLNQSLWHVAEAFQRDCKIDVVYGHRVIIDNNGYDIGKWIMPGHNDDVLSYADFVPQETMYWRRKTWDQVGAQLDESYEFALDWDLLLRFIAAGARIRRLNHFMGGFRRHNAQKTIVDIDTTGFEEMDRLRRRSASERFGSAIVPVFRMRFSIALFLLRAKLFELSWKTGLAKIG